MKAHLTDEEWLDYVNHEANEMVHAHLQFCRECRQEAERIRETLVRFADSVKAEAAQAQARTNPSPVEATSRLPYRRVLALAAGFIVVAGALLTSVKTSGPVLVSNTGAPSTHEVAPAVQSTRTEARPRANVVQQKPVFRVDESDDDLLLQVQNDTSFDMPKALQPVALILAERNQFAEQLTQNFKGENQ